jgi:uncharacterized protein (TIGR02231 family)
LRAAVAVVVLVLAAFAPSGASAAAPIDAGGGIDRVTVHLDGAEVTRVAEIRVPAGESQVRLTRIPLGVQPDSILVRGRGVAASIGAVELRSEVAEPLKPGDSAGLDVERARLDAEGRRLGLEELTDRDLKKYLDSLRDVASSPPAKSEAALQPNPAALAQMLAFLKKGYDDLTARSLEREDRRRALARDLELLNAKLGAGAPQGALMTRAAIVDVHAEDAGTLRLELSYVVPGARWRPTYRAALDAQAGTIDLVSEAVIAQQTGEDWDDVALTLTTAAPSQGLQAPYLATRTLSPVTDAPDIGIGGGTSGQIAYRAGPSGNSVIDGGLSLATPDFLRTNEGDSATLTAAMQSGQQVSYTVPGRHDVASDLAEHRVTLRTDDLPARLAYVTTPELREEAFAQATVTAPEERPLLSGPARVVSGGAYLGQFMLPETSPGADLRIPFGNDSRLEVKRTALPLQRKETGKDVQVTHEVHATVTNRRSVPVSVTLKERIPVAQDESITVKVGAATTPGSTTEADRPGVLGWVLELEPKESKEIELHYTVRHPQGMILPGE